MDRTKIEWTDATWNPIRGCTPVSEGCRNCYAAGVAYRFGQNLNDPYFGLAEWRGGRAVFNGTVMLVDHTLTVPLRWRRPRRIFVNSMSDLFQESVPVEFVDKVFAVMAMADEHTFQVLTKRPERMAEYLKGLRASKDRLAVSLGGSPEAEWLDNSTVVLPNVWLGVSVENQKAADERIPQLLECPAAVRFLSCEPLLGEVDVMDYLDPIDGGYVGRSFIDWIIAGGESGRHARPMDAAWARSLRDQCAEAGVPFLFKQWGEHDERGERVGKKAAGRLLDGRTHDEFPGVVAEAQ